MARPGFTVLDNLDQNDTLARDVLRNLLSSNTTKNFDLENDLQVFRNNVNNTSTFKHYSRIVQGRDHTIAFRFDHTPRDLTNERTYFAFRDSQTGRINYNLENGDIFKFSNGDITVTGGVTFKYADVQDAASDDDPFIYFNWLLSVDPVESAISSGADFGDTVKIISSSEESQAYKLEFTTDGEMKISVYYTEHTFSPSDNIIDIQAIDSSGDIINSITGDFTISDYDIDYKTKIKSFVIKGKEFTSSEQNTFQDAFTNNNIRIIRKNGVTRANLVNASEPNDSLSSGVLKYATPNSSIPSLFVNVKNNIERYNIDSWSKAPLNRLLFRKETNNIFTRDVEITGALRFVDHLGDVDEYDSAISDDAPGLFLYSGDVNASPISIKRAFSEVSNIWTVNDTSDYVEVITGTNHEKATIDGSLTFVDDIRIGVDPSQVYRAFPIQNVGDANGEWSDSQSGLSGGPSADNSSAFYTFTHRIILEVEEENAEGDLVTEEYSIIAVKST